MNRDILSYAVILAGSAFFLAATANIPETKATLASSAFFPRIVLGLACILSVIGICKALRRKAPPKSSKIHYPLFVIIGLSIGYIVLLHLAGFVIATTSFLFFTSLYMYGELNAKMTAMLAVFSFGLAFGVNYVFTEILLFILP